MTRHELGASSLRVAGVALIVLGILHLSASAHIPHLLDGLSPEARAFAVGPTLLNHVLVGILLLPLGFTTWLAAARANVRRPWAIRLLSANCAVVVALPVLVAILMHQPQYYTAPLFVVAVVIAAIVALLVLVATLVVVFARPGGSTEV